MNDSKKWLAIDTMAFVGVVMIVWACYRASLTLGLAVSGALLLVITAWAVRAMGRPLTPVILLLTLSVASQAGAGEIYVPQSPEPIPDVPQGSTLVVRHTHSLSLNPKTRLADWVLYRVNRRYFEGDHVVSPARNWWSQFPSRSLASSAYEGTQYARGHLCPLASFAANEFAWETNSTENLTPQRQELNGGLWLKLENWERAQASAGEVVIVLAGPLFDKLPKANEFPAPTHFWKVVSLGKSGKRHAFMFPQDPDGGDLEKYRVETESLYKKAGLNWTK